MARKNLGRTNALDIQPIESQSTIYGISRRRAKNRLVCHEYASVTANDLSTRPTAMVLSRDLSN